MWYVFKGDIMAELILKIISLHLQFDGKQALLLTHIHNRSIKVALKNACINERSKTVSGVH